MAVHTAHIPALSFTSAMIPAGGSVTHGRGIGGRQRAYGATFEALLNEAFPGCAPAEDAGLRRHEVVVRASGGTASRYALQQFEANMHGLEAQVDMVLVEFAPNDGFMTLSPNMKQENQMVAKRSGGAAAGSLSGERVIQWYTEALVRKVLGLRTANGTLAAAAVWLESSWMGEGLRDALLERNAPAATGTARAHVHAPMRANARMMDVTELMASLSHHAVLSWYGIPTVSLVDVMAPLTFNSFGVWNEGGYDASSAFAWSNIAADRCCHPNLPGHHVMALMLARELDREAQFYGVPRVKEEEDVSARPLSSSTTSAGASTLHVSRVKCVAPGSESDSKHAHLRPLLWLSPSDERKYLSPPYFNLDFMNPRLELGTVMAPGGLGWSFEEDVPGKQGLIAREAGSHAAIVLPMSDVQRAHPEVDRIVLVIGYLSSYQGFSSVSYWIDQTPSLAAERADALDPRRCRRDFNMTLERQVIDATRLSNRGNVSVFESAATKPIAVGDKPMYLHVCLHPDVARLTVDAARRRTKGKFKLLSVVAMHGGEGSE